MPKAQIDDQPNGFRNQSTNLALTQACRSTSCLYGGKKRLGTQSKGTPGVSFWVYGGRSEKVSHPPFRFCVEPVLERFRKREKYVKGCFCFDTEQNLGS